MRSCSRLVSAPLGILLATLFGLFPAASSAQTCESEPWYRDADGDGYGNVSVLKWSCYKPAGYVSDNTDCDDANASIGTKSNHYVDSDRDGYGTGSVQYVCGQAGWSTNNSDCNDGNASIRPGAIETCNGVDDNCNGTVDENLLISYYRDADADSYGASTLAGKACTVPSGHVTNNTDCNDSNAAVKPGVKKTCGTGACARSVDACVGSVEQTCTAGTPAAEECDRVDNNCNGAVDELPALTCGTGACYRSVAACGETCTWDAQLNKNICIYGDSVCAPGNPVAETCDANDNDCDGATDEGVQPVYYRDADGDTYGTGSAITSTTCGTPAGYANRAGDCNDGSAAYRPGANLTCGTNACTYNSVPSCVDGNPNTCTPKTPPPEVCDGADNNCDGQADNMLPQSCGTGECKRTVTTCQQLCVYDVNYPNNEKCTWSRTPCEAGYPTTETCDAKDNDCNGHVDNNPGLAQANTLTRSCPTPNGCSQVGTQTCQAGATWSAACSGCGGEARCTTPLCNEDNYVVCNAQCEPADCPASIPERCNQCDDDLDGVKDDGLSCQPCDL